jgi:hypothetical protein
MKRMKQIVKPYAVVGVLPCFCAVAAPTTKVKGGAKQVTIAFFYLYTMAKTAKKKAAPKKRAEQYEPKVKTDLSFDELIAMSVDKQPEKKESPKKK